MPSLRVTIASPLPNCSDSMDRLRLATLGALLTWAALTGCSKSDAPSHSQVQATPSDRAEAQARGLANANAMVDNAKLCEPESGDPNLVACQRACELNHSNSCANWAALVEPKNEPTALTLYQRACRGGSGIGCEGNARLVHKAGGDEQPVYRNARRYHRIHCAQGYARSCDQLAGLFTTSNGGNALPEAAATFRKRACSLGRETSCHP